MACDDRPSNTRSDLQAVRMGATIQPDGGPNGCSTVCRRTPMASGMRSSRACILSSTPSFTQRLMRRSLVGVHRV